MQRVESSNILAIGYRRGALFVLFKSCRLYRYTAVPKEVYEGLLKAESKGRYFNTHVRDKYKFKEVTP